MGILVFVREKRIGKYILAYLVFILLNYIICLAPIGASYYFSPHEVLLSSFLAYCFTLLSVSIYSFLFFPKEKVGGTIVANLAIIGTIFFIVVYLVMFMLYNLVGDFADLLNASLTKTYLLAFIPALFIPVALGIPMIKQQVASDQPTKVIKTIKKGGAEGEIIRETIKREGI